MPFKRTGNSDTRVISVEIEYERALLPAINQNSKRAVR